MSRRVVITRLHFKVGLRSNDENNYEAFCRSTVFHFDENLIELNGATEYLEVLMSTKPYEVPLLFALKGSEIHAYMPDGFYERWDQAPHNCQLERDVEAPMSRLGRPRVSVMQNHIFSLVYPESADLKPGSRIIVKQCAAITDELAPKGKVNVQFAYKRDYIHEGTDKTMSCYAQRVRHDGQQYEILNARVNIRQEERGSVYVQSNLCSASSPLDFPPPAFFASGDILVWRDNRRARRECLIFCKREHQGGYKLTGPNGEILYREPPGGIVCEMSVELTEEQEGELEQLRANLRRRVGARARPRPPGDIEQLLAELEAELQ